MSSQIIPATITGFEVIEFGFADAESPVLILRREPVVAWAVSAAGKLRPLTASPMAFDLDGDDNTVIGHPNGAVVCRGQPYTRVSEYFDARKEALRCKARDLEREKALDALRRLARAAGRLAALAVLERFRPPGHAEEAMKLAAVPDSRIGELRAAVASELANFQAVLREPQDNSGTVPDSGATVLADAISGTGTTHPYTGACPGPECPCTAPQPPW